MLRCLALGSCKIMDFIKRVLGLDCLRRIQSVVFHFEQNNDALYAKIRQIYGVDVSEIESGNLAEIL